MREAERAGIVRGCGLGMAAAGKWSDIFGSTDGSHDSQERKNYHRRRLSHVPSIATVRRVKYERSTLHIV